MPRSHSLSPRARLDESFRSSARARRAALIGYLPAGYPSWHGSLAAARVLATHCDILEIGVPPQHAPGWDGTEIRDACQIARRACPTTAAVLRFIRALTSEVSIPVTVMSYWGDLDSAGETANVAAGLAAAGATGAVLPDINPQGVAARRWLAAAADHELATALLAVPGQLDEAAAASTGWVYQAAAMGPTGTRTRLDLSRIRSRTSKLAQTAAAPICIGIGVSTPYQAAALAPVASGIVIGTRFVRALAQDGLPGLATVAAEYAAAVSAVETDHTANTPRRAA